LGWGGMYRLAAPTIVAMVSGVQTPVAPAVRDSSLFCSANGLLFAGASVSLFTPGHAVLDFGFWILDFGLFISTQSNN